jgi:hypothetical protein
MPLKLISWKSRTERRPRTLTVGRKTFFLRKPIEESFVRIRWEWHKIPEFTRANIHAQVWLNGLEDGIESGFFDHLEEVCDE